MSPATTSAHGHSRPRRLIEGPRQAHDVLRDSAVNAAIAIRTTPGRMGALGRRWGICARSPPAIRSPAPEAEQQGRPGRHPAAGAGRAGGTRPRGPEHAGGHDRALEVPQRRGDEEDRAEQEEDRPRTAPVQLATGAGRSPPTATTPMPTFRPRRSNAPLTPASASRALRALPAAPLARGLVPCRGRNPLRLLPGQALGDERLQDLRRARTAPRGAPPRASPRSPGRTSRPTRWLVLRRSHLVSVAELHPRGRCRSPRDPRLEHAHGLETERHARGARSRSPASRRRGRPPCRASGRARGRATRSRPSLRAADDLDEGHHGDRIEEVESDDAVPAAGRVGDPPIEQRRRVRGEDGPSVGRGRRARRRPSSSGRRRLGHPSRLEHVVAADGRERSTRPAAGTPS